MYVFAGGGDSDSYWLSDMLKGPGELGEDLSLKRKSSVTSLDDLQLYQKSKQSFVAEDDDGIDQSGLRGAVVDGGKCMMVPVAALNNTGDESVPVSVPMVSVCGCVAHGCVAHGCVCCSVHCLLLLCV